MSQKHDDPPAYGNPQPPQPSYYQGQPPQPPYHSYPGQPPQDGSAAAYYQSGPPMGYQQQPPAGYYAHGPGGPYPPGQQPYYPVQERRKSGPVSFPPIALLPVFLFIFFF